MNIRYWSYFAICFSSKQQISGIFKTVAQNIVNQPGLLKTEKQLNGFANYTSKVHNFTKSYKPKYIGSVLTVKAPNVCFKIFVSKRAAFSLPHEFYRQCSD